MEEHKLQKLPCYICKTIEARNNCVSCSGWMCLKCTRMSTMRMDYAWRGHYDYEIVKRCQKCEISDSKPQRTESRKNDEVPPHLIIILVIVSAVLMCLIFPSIPNTLGLF